MGKSRLEAFSDGVLAILIAIMVLELKVPHGATLADLRPLWPVLLSYVLSFVYLGIYWNNYHHMLHLATRVTGGVLWANLHLLFWLSLLPFATGWLGENHFAALPAALYGVVLLMAALAYWWLQQRIIAVQGSGSVLRRAVGSDWKGKVSPLLYAIAIRRRSGTRRFPCACTWPLHCCGWCRIGTSSTCSPTEPRAQGLGAASIRASWRAVDA